MKQTLLMVLLFCNTLFAISQEISVKGKVKDSQGNAVENAMVSIQNTNTQTFTAADGTFQLTAREGDILVITHRTLAGSQFELNGEILRKIVENDGLEIILQTSDAIFEMSLEELLSIDVYTATKTNQSLSESPATMIVITEQMIKERGYFYLEEILHDLPGFDFNKDFGVNYSTIFMRGFRSSNSDRFVLFFDGINENDIWKQTTWISRQYPVSQIKQIEILYGPASALYGTNAFSGIINVITKKGDEVGDINLTTGYGSWGQKNIEWSTGQQLSDKISYNITAKYHTQDDLHAWDMHDAIDGSPSNFSQDYLNKIGPKLQFKIDGKLVPGEFSPPYPSENYSIHANVQFGNLRFTALNWTKNELEAYFYSPFKRSGTWTQWFENNMGYMLSHEKQLSDKISLSSSLTFRSHNIADSKEGGFKYISRPITDPLSVDYAHSQTIDPKDPTSYQLIPRTVTLDNGNTAYVTATIYHYTLNVWDLALEEQLTYKVSDKLNLIAGARFTHTNTQEDYNIGEHTYNIATTPRHLKKTFAAYAQAIYKPIDMLSLTAGGRIEDQKDEFLKGYTVFTPRFSAVLKASSNLTFRLQYAEAFQEADDWHKFATDFDVRPHNSSHLEPEKLQAVELGTTLTLASKFMISASGYYNIVTNFITEVANTPANPFHGYTYGIHYDNNTDGKAQIYGYEVSFNAFFSENFSLNANVSGAFNYEKGMKMEKGADGNYTPVLDGNGNPETDDMVLIGDIAPVKVNMGVLYVLKNKLTLYPKVNFVSAKQTINWRANLNTPTFREIDAYAILGLNVNVLNILGFVPGLDLNIKLDNILNEQYYNPGARNADGFNYSARILQPGFNFMAGLSYHL